MNGGARMAQVFNPYLPSWEYVPDGEPYVFDGRVYVYGSHDRFGAPMFCVEDYVCWSAPVEDLSDWRCEGIIYRKKDDPLNSLGLRKLFAPDVAKGPDGRYYLYYAFDFMGVMGVAVCDTPAGQYRFHGHVRFPDGRRWGSKTGDELPFDPAVLVDDDGKVYLYSGFQTKVPFVASRFHDLKNTGCVVMELEADMLTIKAGPKLLLPCKGKGDVGDFKGHEFFEAASIRKIDGMYVFVYSSRHNHELCYAVSDKPDGGFRYGGTLVDIGDVGCPSHENEAHADNYLGNTHGGMLTLDGKTYIFYHRQTNQTSYARQACAERLEGNVREGFKQAQITSCGLNDGPLSDRGEYPARIACNLWSKQGVARYDKRFKKRLHPYFTQRGEAGNASAVQYIANMQSGSVAGFKYFDIQGPCGIRLVVSGKGQGHIEVSDDSSFSRIADAIPVRVDGSIINVHGRLPLSSGVRPLYFRYVGTGHIDFYTFALYEAK